MGGTAQVTPTPANTQPQTAPGILHEVIAPDGTRGTASSTDLQSLPSDYKVTVRLRMYAPDGTRGYADPEHLADLTRAGYRLTPETQMEKEGAAPGNALTIENVASQMPGVVKRQIAGAVESSVQPWSDAVNAYDAERAKGGGILKSAGMGAIGAVATPLVRKMKEVLNVPSEYEQRRAEGYNPAYAVAAPVLSQVPGNRCCD